MNNIETVERMYALFAAGNRIGGGAAFRPPDTIRPIFDEAVRWNMMKGFPCGGQHVGVDAIFEQVLATSGPTGPAGKPSLPA